MSNQDASSARPPPQDRASATPPVRRASFLTSLLSFGASAPGSTAPYEGRERERGYSHSSTTSGVSSALAGSPFAPSNDVCGSPNSSVASAADAKPAHADWGMSPPPSAASHERRESYGGSLSGFTSGFRWPGPMAIPEAASAHPPAPVSGSLPTRHSSVSGPTFRRAFELPHYTSVGEEADGHQEPALRRGRAGSLFSSFGGTSEGCHSGSGMQSGHPVPAGNGAGPAGAERKPARRKLSPMGERMIRDHPF